MIYTHNLSQFIIELSPGFGIRWYGFMYLFGFFIGYLFFNKYKKLFAFTKDEVESLLFILFLGVVVGGRIGYIILYSFHTIYTNPLQIFAVWNGGMSIHGGFIGVLLGVIYFAFKYKKNVLKILDFIVIPASIALIFGRIGNFINGELVGFPTGLDFGVIFPQVDNLPRHPSQLYEAFFNFILAILLLFVWKYSYRNRKGLLVSFFMIGYGTHRIISETFWRIGDAYYYGLSLGQWYSIPLVFFGIVLCIYILSKKD